ncbi:CoA transferase [Sphingomonas sp. RT2P30]|uniref:CoA transferase n=1 Tax=Parasphingomonas halimpatiens TaxID=3096162 RepID=UPI002FC828CD
MSAAIPLTGIADGWLRDLARTAGSAALDGIDGRTLLGERAMLGGFRIPARVSAGGGCRLYAARNGEIALNLARADDRDLLPALFETDADCSTDAAVTAHIAERDAYGLVARGRLLGLAIAAEDETGPPPAACAPLTIGDTTARPARAPRVLDLSALWAGPLAAHLLSLLGAEVTKVETRRRPDAMREGDAAFFALLNQGKASVVLDFHDEQDRAALLALIARSDIVIEAARPRALEQLGIRADEIVHAQPGLTWMTITGHGASGDAAHWVGFGDDCGVAAGLDAALRDASGKAGFVGDAIADPLTGIYAAKAAWSAWVSGRAGRLGVAMSGVVAEAMATARAYDAPSFNRDLVAWAASAGEPFASVRHRDVARVSPLGADTRASLAGGAPC